jgi:hypothetical protein
MAYQYQEGKVKDDEGHCDEDKYIAGMPAQDRKYTV